jgi:hypothetical protein
MEGQALEFPEMPRTWSSSLFEASMLLKSTSVLPMLCKITFDSYVIQNLPVIGLNKLMRKCHKFLAAAGDYYS